MPAPNKRKPIRHPHRGNYLGVQPAKLGALMPGMLCEFRYPSKTDKTPLILIIFKDKSTQLMHSINLNYLTEGMIQKLFCECEKLHKGASVYSDEPITRKVQSQMSDYDDTLPNRGLLKEEFTRIMLPTYKERQGGDGSPLGLAEARRQMNMLYKKVLRPIIKKKNIYRTYSLSKMTSMKVVKYQLGEWNQPGMDYETQTGPEEPTEPTT